MSEKAFELLTNIHRLNFMERGDAYDLKAFNFPEMTEIKQVYQNRPLNLPNVTFFYEYSDRKFTSTLDNLHTLQTDCIFSSRMIDVLSSVKSFKFNQYPIAILEEGAVKFQDNPDGYKPPDPYMDIAYYKKKSIRNDLFIVQTLEFLDIFDWEKSDYTQSEFNKERNSPGIVNAFVLRETEFDLPPLFRLTTSPTRLFISSEARDALKKAQIRGPAFLSLRGYRPDSQLQVDVPIS